MGLFLKKGNWWIDYYASGKRKREKVGNSYKIHIKILN